MFINIQWKTSVKLNNVQWKLLKSLKKACQSYNLTYLTFNNYFLSGKSGRPKLRRRNPNSRPRLRHPRIRILLNQSRPQDLNPLGKRRPRRSVRRPSWWSTCRRRRRKRRCSSRKRRRSHRSTRQVSLSVYFRHPIFNRLFKVNFNCILMLSVGIVH